MSERSVRVLMNEAGENANRSGGALKGELESLVRYLGQGRGFVVLNADPHVQNDIRSYTLALAKALGSLVIQDGVGRKLIEVYDRDPSKRMEDGARYHQTHQGGSIHTDNVNLEQRWDLLLLACENRAVIGGETVIVDGQKVLEVLKKYASEAFVILQSNFLFQRRGFGEGYYKAPVITFDERGRPVFRYLREYIVAAHNEASRELTPDQVWALDALDAVLECSDVQYRVRLKRGEIVLCVDGRTLHGRTSFVDKQTPSSQRKMFRAWVRL